MTDLNTILYGQQQSHEKMSLRDQFANTALLVVYLNEGFEARSGRYEWPGIDEIAAEAYRIADAMLVARGEK